MSNKDNDFWEDVYNESFYEYMRELQDQAKEIEWLKKNPHLDIFSNYARTLDYLLSLKDFDNADFLVKMQFSYSVTVLEACLSEMLKSLVLTSGFYIRNALANIPELQKSTVSLLEAYDYQDKSEIEKAVITYLSKVLYHNIPKVIALYSSILGIDKPIHINIENIVKIIALRHDIVHRDGKTIDGDVINISYDDLNDFVFDIKNFLENMHQLISDSVEKQEILRIAELERFYHELDGNIFPE
ncbi:HEPN domain-containing protein (plasmid) [Serratia marcescens]|uniref:HEPN domain-containing protein n=1 Tax=Serratia marcescens TaxID=615 RepID=UPI003FA73A44